MSRVLRILLLLNNRPIVHFCGSWAVGGWVDSGEKLVIFCGRHKWMTPNKINRLHERAQRIDCSDYKSSFNTLLEKNSSFSVHHRNIQCLTIEIYKFLHDLFPAIMGEIIKLNRRPKYNLRTRQEL